jgi:hypothetical protein
MRYLLILFFFTSFYFNAVAQSPNSFNYQAAIRDAGGDLVQNEAISIRITILEETSAGATVYQESHGVTTNEYGLVNINIGEGTILSGTFNNINWGSTSFFVNVGLDINGGTTYTDMGTQHLTSVPYSLHAQTVELSDNDTLNEIQTLSKIGNIVSLSNSGGTVNISDGDSDPSNEIQTLSATNGIMSLSNSGGSVSINNLEHWQKNGSNELTYSSGNIGIGLGVGVSPKTAFHIGNGRRVLWGTDTLGGGDKLMFLPDLHAFRVGTVATGAASTYWDRDSIGLYSFASGLNNRAQGFGATAMGRDCEATNSYAFASGFFSNADGQYSTAMGFNTDAFGLGSTALGYSTDAESNYSFASGYFAEAQAIYSVAVGNAVQAQSYGSMAVGRYNVGGGDATAWVGTSPLFEIGNGTGPSTRSNAMTVLKSGNVGFGTSYPSATLQVIGTTRLGSFEEITDGGSFILDFDATLCPVTNNGRSLGNSSKRWNTVYATNGTINTSDAKDKENIEDLEYGLDEILQLRPVKFNWKDQPETGDKIGLIAQELQEVIGEVVLDTEWVTNEETGQKSEVKAERLGVFYSDLIPVLIKSIQEQNQIIVSQQENMEILNQRLKEQEMQIARILKQLEDQE